MTIYGERFPLRSLAVEMQDNNLHILLPQISQLINGDQVRFVITQSIPRTNPTGTVYLYTNVNDSNGVIVLTRYANDLRIDQIRSRRVYTVGFGAQTPSFTMLSCVPKTSFEYDPYPNPTIPTTPAEQASDTPAESSAKKTK